MANTMKAAVLHAPADLRIEMVTIDDDIAEDQALIRVKAAGVCGSDLDRIMKNGTYSFPTIPGHEFAGEIVKLGTSKSSYKVGDRVAVAPILPCYRCDSCQQGHYGQCDNYSYLGSRTDGGFAEYVKAPIDNLMLLPDAVSFAHGAMVEPAAVTLHGIMRLQITAGDTVAVLGCGTIGLFAIQFAKILGATKIIAVDIADDKLEMAKIAGATTLINGLDNDAVTAILSHTNQKGVDISIETAGTSITQTQAISITKKHGQLLYLGTAHKDVNIAPKVFEHIIRNEINITGSWNSFSAPFPGREWQAVIQYIESGQLEMEPYLTHRITLEELPNMVKKMSERSISFNKVMVEL